MSEDKLKLDLGKCIEQILNKSIDWWDYKKQGKTPWNNYYNDAKMIAESDVFNNELNHLIADLTKECAVLDGTSLSSEKLIKLTNIQSMILALEMFRQRMNSIEDPKEKVSEFNKFDEI